MSNALNQLACAVSTWLDRRGTLWPESSLPLSWEFGSASLGRLWGVHTRQRQGIEGRRYATKDNRTRAVILQNQSDVRLHPGSHHTIQSEGNSSKFYPHLPAYRTYEPKRGSQPTCHTQLHDLAIDLHARQSLSLVFPWGEPVPVTPRYPPERLCPVWWVRESIGPRAGQRRVAGEEAETSRR